MVGTSGSALSRLGTPTASARSFPDLMCGSEKPTKSNVVASRPASMSWNAAGLPL